MCVCEMADVPVCLIATTSTCTMKLERFDKIRTPDKRNFENKFLRLFFSFWVNKLVTKLEH